MKKGIRSSFDEPSSALKLVCSKTAVDARNGAAAAGNREAFQNPKIHGAATADQRRHVLWNHRDVLRAHALVADACGV